MSNTENQKIVYITDDLKQTWEEIQAAAKAEKRGIGYFLCDLWKKIKAVENEK